MKIPPYDFDYLFLSVERIEKATCLYFNITVQQMKELKSYNRGQYQRKGFTSNSSILARQICCYLIRKYLPLYSFKDIADHYSMNPGTVMSGVKRVRNLITVEKRIRLFVEAIERELFYGSLDFNFTLY